MAPETVSERKQRLKSQREKDARLILRREKLIDSVLEALDYPTGPHPCEGLDDCPCNFTITQTSPGRPRVERIK
jgi:hypothetical protein